MHACGFKSPSTTAWIHFNRSRSLIANVALVYCLITDLQVIVGDQEIGAQQVERGHLNLARTGHLNLAARSLSNIHKSCFIESGNVVPVE
jgi:hypothetical protein